MLDHESHKPSTCRSPSQIRLRLVTLACFRFSLAGHWLFGWYAYVHEARAHGQQAETRGYAVEMMRDTLENWQSEFLQLVWQVGGLMFLFCVGSSQSKEGDERLEAKVDFLMERVEGGADKKAELDARFARE